MRGSSKEGSGYSVIDEHLTIHGDVDTSGSLRVDGRLEGQLHRAGSLIVGPTGVVVGNVDVRELIVAGTVEGKAHAGERMEIQRGARVKGEIHARTLSLHEGGTVDGRLSVGPPESAAPAPAARRLDITPAQSAASRGRS